MRASPVLAALFLAGCATTPPPLATAPPPSPGMEKLMGQVADTAIGLLGAASLDRRDGPARQLQFAGACILDLFYYARPGTQPVATHAEARLPDGRPVPAGDCFSQLLAARAG